MANLACSKRSFLSISEILSGWFRGGGGTLTIFSRFFNIRLE